MARGILWIVLAVYALLLAGCSNHPPSAAQFMNVKENENSLGVGGTVKIGDLHQGKYRFENDYSDGEYRGDFDLSYLHRYSHLVVGLYSENLFSLSALAGFRTEYIGVQGWLGGAFIAVDEQAPFYGGLRLIEEYPVNWKFRVGLSEHFSRNAYFVDKNGAGLGSPSTGFYNEFGGGAYLAYKSFSVEMLYGREIDEPRNRFYLMVNYSFEFDG